MTNGFEFKKLSPELFRKQKKSVTTEILQKKKSNLGQIDFNPIELSK